MAKSPRRNQTAALKAKVVIYTINGEQALVEFDRYVDFQPNQIISRKKKLNASADEIFEEANYKKRPCEASCRPRPAYFPWKTIFSQGAQTDQRTERKSIIYNQHSLPVTCPGQSSATRRRQPMTTS